MTGCDAPPDGQINYLVIDPTVHHPNHVPPRHDFWEKHFPCRNEKTATEDFTKTMGFKRQ
jgi:hypothetical protein